MGPISIDHECEVIGVGPQTSIIITANDDALVITANVVACGISVTSRRGRACVVTSDRFVADYCVFKSNGSTSVEVDEHAVVWIYSCDVGHSDIGVLSYGTSIIEESNIHNCRLAVAFDSDGHGNVKNCQILRCDVGIAWPHPSYRGAVAVRDCLIQEMKDSAIVVLDHNGISVARWIRSMRGDGVIHADGSRGFYYGGIDSRVGGTLNANTTLRKYVFLGTVPPGVLEPDERTIAHRMQFETNR
jgi:hypothetical protein